MTRKQKRLAVILAGMSVLGVAVGLTSYALRDKITFFVSPSDIANNPMLAGQMIRLGGLVEKGSLLKSGTNVSFSVTDMAKSIKVSYVGQLPDLFREGQGVVAEGSVAGDGAFVASTILAKHDERYMPRDVADKLKQAGVWREDKEIQ